MLAAIRDLMLVLTGLWFAVGHAAIVAAADSHTGPAMNYHAIDARLATGGHLIGNGLDQLAAEGLQVVIDVRGETPPEQVAALAARGIRLVNVPVSWQQPTVAEYRRFAAALRGQRGEKVLVQCAANYRASAMTYLYRVIEEKAPEPQAWADMEAVWQPNATWRRYFRDVVAATAAAHAAGN